MQIALFIVPYDSGRRDTRMGAGPGALIEAGLLRDLEVAGFDITLESIEDDRPWRSEITTSFGLYRRLAEAVRRAREADRFPLTLGGNCGTTLGALSGLEQTPSLLWFDCHGDFNTPDTSTSGFLDGMLLAAIAGRCWRGLSGSVPGFEPLDERRIALVGARDLDVEERELLAGSGVVHVRPESVRTEGVEAALSPVLNAISGEAPTFYVHIDLDVFDPDEARGNSFATPGGLRVSEVLEAVRLIGASGRICGATLAAYEPAVDIGGNAASAGKVLAALLCGLARS